MQLNIGNPAGDEYFGLTAGRYPGAEGTPRPAKGGGDFAGAEEVRLSFKHEQRVYLVKFAATKTTLAPDISSGDFSSELTTADNKGNAVVVTGSFTCGSLTPVAEQTIGN